MGSIRVTTTITATIATMSTLHPSSARRKSSTVTVGTGAARKLSQDVTRKLSAISTAPDISALSNRLGMDQDHLKTIVNDILDMDTNNKWEDGEAEAEELSEDEFEDEGWQTDEQIYETVRIEQRKKESTSSQGSSGEDPVDIDVAELNTVLDLYMRHQVSVTSFVHHEKNIR